jgi:acyl-CoA synthetase (AMP-forming)/AMP-acid ligase II
VPISAIAQEIAHEIVAFVVPRGALSHAEIERHCHARLPADRLPDRIYYPNDLARIAGSKVNRQRLLEIAAEERAKQGGAS